MPLILAIRVVDLLTTAFRRFDYKPSRHDSITPVMAIVSDALYFFNSGVRVGAWSFDTCARAR